MQRISFLIVIFALLNLALAACKKSLHPRPPMERELTTTLAPPSFCKCTCFNNSTIIQLGPSTGAKPHSPSSSDSSTEGLTLRSILEARAAGSGGSSCNKCNRAFCLAQGIPFCKNAEEKDVFTTCFQRDSRKDQIIVLIFIAATVGLLVWAGVRRLLEKRGVMRRASTGGLGEYVAVGGR